MYFWYCAEYDTFEFQDFPPHSIFKVRGWKQYVYWRVQPNESKKPLSTTMLTEYIYIGEL